jgi:hypothetical protein
MTAVDPDVSFLVDALEPRGPSTQATSTQKQPGWSLSKPARDAISGMNVLAT